MPLIPTLWEAQADGSLETRSLRPAWPTWQNAISTKTVKISRAWWHVSVISATGEADTGELLEPRIAMSRDRAIALQPGRQRKTLSQKKPTTVNFSLCGYSF